MKNKIINYLMENFSCDEVETEKVQQFITAECDTDDIHEFANLLVYFENIPKSLTDFIFDKISD